MYKVYGKNSASVSWTCIGTYGSEQSAMVVAENASRRFKFIKVVDKNGATVWSC
jgi:hypothetical protein